MIDRLKFESDPDMAAVFGRATLALGSGYGLYKTAKEAPNILQSGYFQRSMSKFAGMSSSIAPNKIDSTVSFKSFFKDYQGTLEPRRLKGKGYHNISTLTKEIEALGGGYKGRSAGLSTEISGLYNDLSQRFKDIEIRGYNNGSNLEYVKFKAGDFTFDVPLVNREGLMRLTTKGENQYVARSVFKDLDNVTKKVEIEGLDVALTRKYREQMGSILSGKVSPKALKRSATDKAVWEETKGVKDLSKITAKPLQELRREQVAVDIFGERTTDSNLELMKRITSTPGYGGGSASMFAKNVFATPESLLSRGLPAAEASTSAYQLIRMSEFVNAPKPSISLPGGLESRLGQFKVAAVNDKEALRRALKKAGVSIGELADEEAILALGDIGIKNNMYNFNISLDKQTELSRGLLRDIYTKAEKAGIDPRQVSKAMTGGKVNLSIQNKLADIMSGIDINEKYKRLERREVALNEKINFLQSERNRLSARGGSPEAVAKLQKQINASHQARGSVRKAIGDFGLLGYDELGQAVKVPAGDMSNFIRGINVADGKLSIATESHFKFGAGSKIFTGGGGGKWTIKAQADVPLIMGWMEAEKIYGDKANISHALDLSKAFKNISMISAESPIKIKGGALAPRETMMTALSYASSVMESGDAKRISALEEIGFKDGSFIGSSLSGKEMIEKIEKIEGQGIDKVMAGEEFLSARVSNMIAAPDISRTQSGFGQVGTLSERAAFNLQSSGLDKVLEDLYSRRSEMFSPLGQFQQIQIAKNIAKDPTASGKNIESVIGDVDRVFQSDVAARRRYFGDQDRLTINLGKEIAGINKINVFASDVMTPYIGEGKAGRSQLDQAQRDLLLSISRGEDESFQTAKAKKLQSVMQQVEESISDNLFKGKVKGSMYGGAVSSLEGMDQAAVELGKKMGLSDDLQAPLIAMSKADIRRQFGKEAMKKAVEGDLWGIMTREPIEGSHSTIPVNIRVAEDFGFKGKEKGGIFLSGEDKAKGLMRKGLFVDFDKDPLNVMAIPSEEGAEQIKKFYGYEGRQPSAMGGEFLESLKRMSAFELKGRDPLSITNLFNDELAALNAAQKGLEKGAIGSFSSEFKNIHIGLREQLTPNMGRSAAEAYYLGEDFSHLFIENILKAKHQRKEALVSGSVQDTLDLLRGTVGTKYSEMGTGDRASALQGIFDELTFGNKEVAEQARSSAEMTESLAERMGFAKEIQSARSIENAEAASQQISDILKKAEAQRVSFRKISSMDNINNVLGAYQAGREINKGRDYASVIGTRMITEGGSTTSRMKDIASGASAFMTKGLKNIAKYGILPTAAIGLAASLATRPKVLQPALDAGTDHEAGNAYPDDLGRAKMGKTLFSIPESGMNSYAVKGKTHQKTNFDMLKNQKNISSTISVHDNRSHLDKYKVEEMISKGY